MRARFRAHVRPSGRSRCVNSYSYYRNTYVPAVQPIKAATYRRTTSKRITVNSLWKTTMNRDLPYATPYPWRDEEMDETHRVALESLRKRRHLGSGFAFLQKQALGKRSRTHPAAKSILVNLLKEHDIEYRGWEENAGTEVQESFGSRLLAARREAVDLQMGDDDVLDLAREGKISLLASLLKVIEQSDSPVAAKHLIKTCCLTPRPGDVPGAMDARDMVLAALHFLASPLDVKSQQFASLPLIRSTQEVGDLEKRSYERYGDWKLSDILGKVLRLDQAFMSSPHSWKWLSREKFCPRLSSKDELSFFLKGSIPASATGKKAKAEGTRKRKAMSPTIGLSSSEPVVEATVVMDASPTHST